LKHWIDGGETNPHNMTLLCTYHHRALHEGGFSIVREDDDTLRFVTADGRTIPQHGYQLEDFVDDDIGEAADNAEDSHDATENPSREGFCTGTVQHYSAAGFRSAERDSARHEVRDAAAVYRIRPERMLAS
jgi:hypothetical protein